MPCNTSLDGITSAMQADCYLLAALQHPDTASASSDIAKVEVNSLDLTGHGKMEKVVRFSAALSLEKTRTNYACKWHSSSKALVVCSVHSGA